mmetsp:Transcript_23076/g.42388  ORF Transcript_23076/g.42388 Transcript_23076/m.42388 type:complete len:605 (+) Transcript_23076:131-1945(+)
MLIVSWNVAGLKPALQRIQTDYSTVTSDNTKSKSATASSSSHPFANYLKLHGSIDILCLQEHKIPLTQLSNRSEPHRCSMVDGYESFWSCATGQKSRGFNGVVTYAKTGLVRLADSAPFNDSELDQQGRCVMTDHGKFVLFNVYVPCGGDEETLPKKMRFLNALYGAMKRQRKGGKHVILVGDMNLKIDKLDLYWKWRRVNVDDLLNQMKEDDGKGDHSESLLPDWKNDIANNWDDILRVLQTIEAIPRQTTNPSTRETFNRFRARVKTAENKFVMLGSYEDDAEDALDYYTLDEQSYIDPVDNTATVYRKKNLLSIEILTELMSKIANVSWNEKTQRQIAESSEAGLNPDSPAYLWMKTLLEEDGMVDVFRHFYPAAEARFTCWHQFMQKRYTNEGGRIDFTLVDKALLNYVEPNDNQTLRCGKEPHTNPLGEEAALLAATAGGMFEPGSFAGGGIAVATKRALDTQFGEVHSGMIYTPPSYSDHIAISLLMKSSFNEYVGEMALGSDASTRKAQPHKKQRSMASFLCAVGSKSSSTSLSGDKRTISQQDTKTTSKKKSLHSYFDESKAVKKTGSSRSTNSTKSNKKKPSIPKNSVLKHFSKK